MLTVMFTTYCYIYRWVGDDDPTWDGLKGCITKMAYSAWKNYPNFGCDMAGYKVAKVKQSLELYVRWVQLGAASPLMENGGNNEHRPWAWYVHVS